MILIIDLLWLLFALANDCLFFMLSGQVMFASLVLLLFFWGAFDRRGEIPWNAIFETGFMVRDGFLYLYIFMTLEALLLRLTSAPGMPSTESL
ncbi:unnamed protein product [Aureobasidium mustum]|uniref:Uncharacterized protein n=1 Tax=Aureobasidium mustum TaxID=2773714 RepID=A0A9N8K2L9_9PEZI|nr:unnamed protein product [Aureobasidium mustum]